MQALHRGGRLRVEMETVMKPSMEDLLYAIRQLANQADFSGYDARTVKAIELAFQEPSQVDRPPTVPDSIKALRTALTEGLRAPPKWHIEARFRRPDGTERVEDLGVHEALVGRKAKAQAIARHAGRMGWRAGKRGAITTGWSFRIHLAKETP